MVRRAAVDNGWFEVGCDVDSQADICGEPSNVSGDVKLGSYTHTPALNLLDRNKSYPRVYSPRQERREGI